MRVEDKEKKGVAINIRMWLAKLVARIATGLQQTEITDQAT